MRKVEEIIVKRKCKVCHKFHFRKKFKFVDESKIDQTLLSLEWYIFKIEEGYYDRVCK